MRPVPSRLHHQRGIVMLLMLVILIVGASALLLRSLSSVTLRMERDKVTADALAQAREALIGYAVAADLATNPSAASPRPGNLPCPDSNNDGTAEANCSGSALGRLPWKTLGLPDLRDGSGERLWYAVSSNFKKSPATSCSAPGQSGCLNSDTKGTITVFGADGTLLYDGGGNSGVVAVILSPGDVLTRQGGSQQDRSGAGVNSAVNYLDLATIGGNTEDNANFTDTSSTNGFIQGPVRDTNGTIIVNDQLLLITQDSIMQAVQRRVAAEVRQCLTTYASAPGIGRYPWASQLINYNDTTNTLLGRIPDTPFSSTVASNASMSQSWPASCNIASSSGWWLNWKDQVFYGLASGYAPTGAAACGTCITVNPPSVAANKKFVVIVAGKKLAGQNRPSTSLNDYLENPDNTGAALFAQSAPSATFNDTVIFQ